MPKVFITKYALTRGIIECYAELVDGVDSVRYAHVKRPDFSVWTREFALTEDAALTLAADQRQRKIAALRKQIAKLTQLQIAVVKR